MFSKKMMIYSAISIFFSLTYKSIFGVLQSIPSSLYRPLLILVVISLFFLIRMYMRGDLTEEKMIEKIVERGGDEFASKK
jgi:hypothetical protein